METRLSSGDKLLEQFSDLLFFSDFQAKKIDDLFGEVKNIIDCKQSIEISKHTWPNFMDLGFKLLSIQLDWENPSTTTLLALFSQIAQVVSLASDNKFKKEIPVLTDEIHFKMAHLYRQVCQELDPHKPNWNSDNDGVPDDQLNKKSEQFSLATTSFYLLRDTHFFSISNNEFINDLESQETYLALLSDCLHFDDLSLVNLDLLTINRLGSVLLAMAEPKSKWYNCFAAKKSCSLIFNNSLLTLHHLYKNYQQGDQAEFFLKTAAELEIQFEFNPHPIHRKIVQSEREASQFRLKEQRECYRTIIFDLCKKAPFFFEKDEVFKRIIIFINYAYKNLGKTYQFTLIEQELCKQICSLLSNDQKFDVNNFILCLNSLFEQIPHQIKKLSQNCALVEFLEFLSICLDSDYPSVKNLRFALTHGESHETSYVKPHLIRLKKQLEKNIFNQGSLASLSSNCLDLNPWVFATLIFELQARVSSLEQENKKLNEELGSISTLSGSKRKSAELAHTSNAGTLFQAEKKLNEPQQKKEKISDEHSSIQEQNQQPEPKRN